MKIRFYHNWIYKLYRKFWNPIYRDHPDYAIAMRDQFQQWLDYRENEIQNRRNKFRIVKKDDNAE